MFNDDHLYANTRKFKAPLGLVALPPLLAMTFACAAWEAATVYAPDMMLIAVGGSATLGVGLGFFGIWWIGKYIKSKPPSELDPSEKGTALDPELYNVADDAGSAGAYR